MIIRDGIDVPIGATHIDDIGHYWRQLKSGCWQVYKTHHWERMEPTDGLVITELLVSYKKYQDVVHSLFECNERLRELKQAIGKEKEG